MDWQQDYEQKCISLDEVFERHITGHQKIYTGGLHVASTLIKEMLKRVSEGALEGLDLYGNWMNGDFPFDQLQVTPEQFRYHTYFAGPEERKGFGSKCITHIPVHFSDVGALLASLDLDYAVVQMTPPDAHGYCNIGPLGFEPSGVKCAKHIVAQINRNLPRVFGDSHDFHVSQIEAFFVCDEELENLVLPDPTPEELKAAEYVVERVDDGSTIQLGIGGISNAIAKGLESKKHLGAFTEMYSDALVDLQMKGVIDNSRKNFMPGKSVGGYSTGAKRLYDYIDENPAVYFTSYDVVCNPYYIAQNDNLISLNTALSVDLTGQVCAESIGTRQYSASGGQFDFVRGAKMSKGGKSFIAVTSVAHTKNGPVSKIAPILASGSAVTSLRNDVQYIVTEYGVADLRFADIPTRAKRLIAIAHPDFRDELTAEAKKLGFLY